MRLLLDTHAFLWFVLDDPRLSPTAGESISEAANVFEVSPATLWEIAIKIRLGKYALPEPFASFVERELSANQFHLLPIEPKHVAVLTTLPFHHRDPFDRLLVAQAMVEHIPLISRDAALEAYSIQRVW